MRIADHRWDRDKQRNLEAEAEARRADALHAEIDAIQQRADEAVQEARRSRDELDAKIEEIRTLKAELQADYDKAEKRHQERMEELTGQVSHVKKLVQAGYDENIKMVEAVTKSANSVLENQRGLASLRDEPKGEQAPT